MKKIMALILSLFSGAVASSQSLNNEASMGFDLENVAPFLSDLEAKYKFGIEVNKLAEFTASVQVEEEKSIIIEISDSGRNSKMEFRVFMDDVEAPDIYMFFDSPQLSEAVGNYMLSWAEEHGM